MSQLAVSDLEISGLSGRPWSPLEDSLQEEAAGDVIASPAAQRWISRKLFSLVHGNQLIYNQCWEDPRLDRIAMELSPRDNVLVITSAGCNALDYVLTEPAHVFAVDVNAKQNALLELKIAGIRTLDYEDFFQLFGLGRCPRFPQWYRDVLRSRLSEPSRKFWDRRQHLFSPEHRRGSFYFRGTTGLFAWLINGYVNRVARAREVVLAMLNAATLDDQRRIYHSELHPVLFTKPMRWFVRRDSALSLLGVPRAQRDQIDRDWPGGVAQFIEDCVRGVFSRLPLRDNYFWRVYLTGQYSHDCCPEYLKPHNFQMLKDGLVDRISIHTSTIADFLRGNPARISRFVLLDHMDWLSSHDITALWDEWQQLIDHATPNARFLWRSAGLRTDFIDRLNVDVQGKRARVGELLRYRRGLADHLHQHDRVHTYGSFHIADLA